MECLKHSRFGGCECKGRKHVDCQEHCGAYSNPDLNNIEELRAAYEHWYNHGYLNGCSHGC